MFELFFANDVGRSGVRARRRFGSRRALAIESLETRDLLTAVAAAESFANLDRGHEPPAARVEPAIRDAHRAGSGAHLPGTERHRSPPPNHALTTHRQPARHDDPGRHENRPRANPQRVPFPEAPASGNEATRNPVVTAAGFSFSAVNAPANLSADSLSPISSTQATSTSTAGQTPLLAAPAHSLLTSLVSTFSASPLSLSFGGEGETPQSFSSDPSATGTGVSLSAKGVGTSSRAVVASSASPESNDAAKLIPIDLANWSATRWATSAKADLAIDPPLALWANYQRQESLAAIDAVFADEQYAVSTRDWPGQSPPQAWLVSDQMIDIAALYDASFVAEPDWLFMRQTDAERPRVAEEAAAESQVSRLPSRGTYLLRFHLDEIVFVDQEDDEEDDEDVWLADEPTEIDDSDVALVESPSSDVDGMIEMSHDDGPPMRSFVVADSRGDATAKVTDRFLEHGAYIKTIDGATRYQAFDIGPGPEPECASDGATPSGSGK